MKYLLLHTLEETATPNTEQCGAPDRLDAWIAEMTERGVVLDGARLRPVADATIVRAPEGRAVVTDGPFAETKEQVAGYDVVECDDLDMAIAVAAAHPTTHVGAIEVRAFDAGMPDPEVSDDVADGKRRYLMLVCADMRGSGAEDAAPSNTQPDTQPTQDDAEEDTSDIDTWIDTTGDRRLYGWALDAVDTAVTVRRVDGRVVTTDGPFAETKEQVAGYDLLECTDLDEAIDIAAAHPVAAGGVLELRPLW